MIPKSGYRFPEKDMLHEQSISAGEACPVGPTGIGLRKQASVDHIGSMTVSTGRFPLDFMMSCGEMRTLAGSAAALVVGTLDFAQNVKPAPIPAETSATAINLRM
jgi:hypothetical protein